MQSRRNFPESWYVMKIDFAFLRGRATYALGCVGLLVSLAPAQTPEARIVAQIDNSVRTTLAGTRPPLAQPAYDAGRMPGTTTLQGVNIAFSLSETQKSSLEALIAAQQNPDSPQYHQWLTPDQYAAQFGASDADVAKVQTWLAQQGLTVNGVSRSRNTINFSGTVAQIEAAFETEMHYFNVGSEKHFAPANDLSVPAAFGPAILGVVNIADFRPKPHVKQVSRAVKERYTYGNGYGIDLLQPGDVSVIYDINAAYSAGYNGSGQSIAVVGQSAVLTSDIANFQSASHTTVRTPTMILVPGTGPSTINPYGLGDEVESDLDLEYSGGIAQGANIFFVYTGYTSNQAYGTLDAMVYAIQQRIAPIITDSYGGCETYLGTTDYTYYNNFLSEAATQGQTVIAAAGDNGSADCYEFDGVGLTAAQQGGLAVDFPASSQYVTALGGTEFPLADITTFSATGTVLVGANSANYWAPSVNGSFVLTSALKYVPEQVWNDDSPGTSGSGLSAGGGGVSTMTLAPSWQATTVPGLVANTYRQVPDIALAASPNYTGYLYCSSDSSTGVTGSCTNGFLDSQDVDPTIAGGTSFAAPIFAGMLAIINQKSGALYQGLINPTLYKLASTPATYASAFHDITTGNNACASGAEYEVVDLATNANVLGPPCLASTNYSAGVGYDSASGLGSVDVYNLANAFPATAPLTGSTTTVTAATLTPGSGAADTITFKVASASSSVTTTPTGTINLSVDGTFLETLALTSGTASYIFSSTVAGSHQITAAYTGDTNFYSSSGTVTVTVVASSTAATTTTLLPATTPAIQGTADAIAITVVGITPSSPAPTGSVSISLDGTTVATAILTPGTTTSTGTYSLPGTTSAGTHTVAAQYLGDANYKTSTQTLTLSVASPGTFALSEAALSVADGATGTESITITPSGGFTGAVNLAVSAASIANACYTVTGATVTGTSAASGTLTIYTNANNCPGNASPLVKTGAGSRIGTNHAPSRPGNSAPVGVAMAGLLALGFAGRRSRKLRGLIAVALLAVAGFAMAGCGSSSTTGEGINLNALAGSYTITVTGSDAATGTKSATSNFTFTIQ